MERLEAVEHPLVPFVRNPRFRLVFAAGKVLQRDRRIVARRRMWIERHAARGKPVLTCAECNAPVYIRSSVLRRWYFRHEDRWGENCPFQDAGRQYISDIDAYRYNGQKEGPLHREMKRLVRESLQTDTRFSEIREEVWWRGTYDPTARRRPDLRADYVGLRIAFEMQPSATYISVISARREFFLAEGALLFWIFPRLHVELLRLYQEDVFFNNNCNIFVADEETLDQSRRAGKFTLRCHYWRPHLIDGQVNDEPESALVQIDDLTIAQKRQEVYCFDYRSERAKVERMRTQPQDELLRKRFIDFWVEYGATHTEEAQEKYGPLRRAMGNLRLLLPVHRTEAPFYSEVRLVLSAQLGRPIGYRYEKLIQVAHRIFDAHKPYLFVFGWICEQHGNDRIINAEDTSGRWRAKVEEFKRAVERRDPAFAPVASLEAIVEFLEPGITERLAAARARWENTIKT